jgi:hypothetical protein
LLARNSKNKFWLIICSGLFCIQWVQLRWEANVLLILVEFMIITNFLFIFSETLKQGMKLIRMLKWHLTWPQMFCYTTEGGFFYRFDGGCLHKKKKKIIWIKILHSETYYNCTENNISWFGTSIFPQTVLMDISQ